MSIHHKYILPLLGLACALSACSDDMPPTESAEAEQNVVLRLSLSPFANDPSPRSTLDGLAWEAGDGFRMRITCPYTTDHQNGELWSSGYHNLLFPTDMGATVVFGTISSNQSQATTYIYTAQNTTGTRTFVVNDYRYKRPSNFFHADQSKLDQFKESDVLWAQGIRQTGAQEVHLNFEHKVARLDITLDDSELTRQEWDEEVGALVDVADPLSANAILTLEGMPDIDGAELVVGDYYAPMTYEYEKFSYREKASCGYTLNGKVLGSLRLRDTYGVNVSRVIRGDVKLLATDDLRLQYGDRVTVVGSPEAINHVETFMGNAVQTLNEPNLGAIFFGVMLGLALGTIPINLPGMSAPVRLGMAGGPIIVGILVGALGPRTHFISYTTRSASLMLRKLGLALYLACLGLDAGGQFFETVVRPEGLLWVGLGFILTVVPVLIVGVVMLKTKKYDFGSICGILCGSMANPMALGYANDTLKSEHASVSYASVYPLGMFIRVVIAQVLVMCFI